MISEQRSDAKFCVLTRSSPMCVKIANPTRQHNNTKIVMSPKMMFPSSSPYPVDAFCRFSRLETHSNDLYLFFAKF